MYNSAGELSTGSRAVHILFTTGEQAMPAGGRNHPTMNSYRRVLLVTALALMGCSSPGHNSGVGYSNDARSALKASRAWVAAPQNLGLLKVATQQCQAAVTKYADTEPSKWHSYRNLDQLKSMLETSQTAVNDGQDPTKMWASVGVCPIDSVKVAQSQLGEDLSIEEAHRQ